MGTTVECDSLLPYGIHLLRVPTAPSPQEGALSLQHTILLLLTTGENNPVLLTTNKPGLIHFGIVHVKGIQHYSIIDTLTYATGIGIHPRACVYVCVCVCARVYVR